MIKIIIIIKTILLLSIILTTNVLALENFATDGVCGVGWFTSQSSAINSCFNVRCGAGQCDSLDNVGIVFRCSTSDVQATVTKNNHKYTLAHSNDFDNSNCPTFGGSGWVAGNVTEWQCQSGFTFDDITHTCIVDGGGACVGGTTTAAGYFDVGTQITETPNVVACSSGCTVIFQGNGAFRELQNGIYTYFYIGQYDQDGTTCASGETATNHTNDPPTATCGAGQTAGTLNDEIICVDVATGEPVNPYEPPPVETETETTTENTVDNGDGTSTTTTTTTNNGSGGGTTTTTTTTNTDNSTGDTINSTTIVNETAPPEQDPKKPFCEENPDSVICADSTVTGGASCGSPPVCTGDAIQCAITEQIFLTRCAIEVPDNLSVDVSDVNTQAGNDTGLNINNVFDVAPENIIDLSDPLNGYVPNVLGSCPPPYTFTFRGNTIDLPLTAICDFADLVRPLILLLAFLSASFIYFNGLVREF